MVWFIIPYSLTDEDDFTRSCAAAVKAANKDEAIETFEREGVGDGYLSSDKIWGNPPDWFDSSVERADAGAWYITGMDFEGSGEEEPETSTRLLAAHYSDIKRFTSWEALEQHVASAPRMHVADVLGDD